MEESSPWEKLRAQCILGGRGFIERISPVVRQKSELTRIPKHERFAFKPPLEEVLGRMTEEARWREAG